MGGYDALVQYNECAVRQFINKWSLYKDEGISHADFIKTQSEEVGIHLNNIDFDHYRQEVYLWYLIHPYGCIDIFIEEFKHDLKTFGFDIKSNYPDKNALEKLILGLQDAGISVSVEGYKLDLDKYYRRSRNLLAHKLSVDAKRKVEQVYDTLQKENIFNWYPSLSAALSAPCHYTFDDYTLCTANLKNITDTLTTDVYNSIDWDKFDITKLPINKLRKFVYNKPRLQKAVRGHIRSNYGIALPDDELDIIVDKIIGS